MSAGHFGPFAFVDIELADHDDDGSQDLGYVTTTGQQYFYAVESKRGLGDGSFGDVYPATQPYLSAMPPPLVKGDVLGAGEEGFVMAVQVLFDPQGVCGIRTFGFRNDGQTTIEVGAAAEYFDAGFSGLALGDWNDDGLDDPVMGDGENGRFLRWLSIGEDGLWSSLETPVPDGNFLLNVVAGDWDEDGDDDVMAVYGFGTGYATFTGPLADEVVPFDTDQFLLEPVSGDFDGDGHADVAGIFAESGEPVRLAVLRGAGDGTFAPLVFTTPSTVTLNVDAASHLHAGDLDGDGRDDLALIIPGGGRACVFLGTATGEFTFFADTDLEGAGSDTLAIGDVDGDGDLDLVIGNATTLEVRSLLNDRL